MFQMQHLWCFQCRYFFKPCRSNVVPLTVSAFDTELVYHCGGNLTSQTKKETKPSDRFVRFLIFGFSNGRRDLSCPSFLKSPREFKNVSVCVSPY